MKKLVFTAVLVVLALPAGALAGRPQPPKHPVVVSASARQNAAFACKAERTALGTTAFEAKYGANTKAHGQGRLRNAFGKCVSKQARLAEEATFASMATGTLTVTAPVAPSTMETVSLTGTISSGKPLASGSFTGSLSVDLSKQTTDDGVSCAPASGTITLSDNATPTANTIVKTLGSDALFCTSSSGSALHGSFTTSGTGSFASMTSVTGVESLLADSSGAFKSVEFGK